MALKIFFYSCINAPNFGAFYRGTDDRSVEVRLTRYMRYCHSHVVRYFLLQFIGLQTIEREHLSSQYLYYISLVTLRVHLPNSAHSKVGISVHICPIQPLGCWRGNRLFPVDIPKVQQSFELEVNNVTNGCIII